MVISTNNPPVSLLPSTTAMETVYSAPMLSTSGNFTPLLTATCMPDEFVTPTVTAGAELRQAAIKLGMHQIREVDGKPLEYPSQNLLMIESDADDDASTHVLHRHVGKTVEYAVNRIESSLALSSAGSFTDLSTAQRAVDDTIAVDQRFIAKFLKHQEREVMALPRVDLQRDVGFTVSRDSVKDGKAEAMRAFTATVVLIHDEEFPEHYRVLTAYPESRKRPEVSLDGLPIKAPPKPV